MSSLYSPGFGPCKKQVPQGLKPKSLLTRRGTSEAVP